MDIVRFDSDSIQQSISKLSAEELDQLAFGAVKLDARGKVLLYNATEGEITGRNPQEMIGKNFFKEVAPCTNLPDFSGNFFNGVRSGKLDALIEFCFDYKMAPTKVKVLMKNDIMESDQYWLFVKRL